MATIDRDEIVKINIEVHENGSVWIHVEKHAGGDDTFQFLYQSLGLTVEQSKDLYDQLKEHFGDATDDEPDGSLDHLYDDTTLPEEPEEAGLYVSQQGHVLRKYSDTDWGYASSNLFLYDREKQWSNGNLYTNNWDLVVKDLGVDAFPLKHIDRSYIASLAQSKSESEE